MLFLRETVKISKTMEKVTYNTKYLVARDFYKQIEGKIALVKSDFNVPIHENKVSDLYRIEKSSDFIIDLIRNNTIPLLATHLGRPNGYDKKYTLDVIADPINNIIGKEVKRKVEIIRFDPKNNAFFKSTLNKNYIKKLFKENKIPLLDNLRFHPDECENRGSLARALAEVVDISIQNSFGTSHRKEDTSSYIHTLAPGLAGDLLVDEIEEHIRIKKPNSPYTIIVGGDKVADSLNLIRRILWAEKTSHPINTSDPNLMRNIGDKLVDHCLIGGHLMYAFIYAQLEMASDNVLEKIHPEAARNLRGLRNQKFLHGVNQDKKELEEEIRLAKGLLRLYNNYQLINQFKIKTNRYYDHEIISNRRLIIPVDYTALRGSKKINLTIYDLQAGDEILDIGKKTQSLYGKVITQSQTIVWNGSMGTDDKNYVDGTRKIMDYLDKNKKAFKSIGGGSSNYIVHAYEDFLRRKLDVGFRSTGGGATLLEVVQDSYITICLRMSYIKLISGKYGTKHKNIENAALIKYGLAI